MSEKGRQGEKGVCVSPRTQCPVGSPPADRTPPMRALRTLCSQHSLVHSLPCCKMDRVTHLQTQNRRVFIPQKKQSEICPIRNAKLYFLLRNILLWCGLNTTQALSRYLTMSALTHGAAHTHRPAAVLEPVSDIVPHVVRLKRVEQEIGRLDKLCSFLVFSQFAEGNNQYDP